MKRFLIFFCTLIAFRSWVAALLLTGGSLMAVDFQRDIQPILVRYCYKCHGPDENKREGKLRLDQREGAYAEHKGVRSAKTVSGLITFPRLLDIFCPSMPRIIPWFTNL